MLTTNELTDDAKLAWDYLIEALPELPPRARPLLIAYCQQWGLYQIAVARIAKKSANARAKPVAWTVYSQMQCSLKSMITLDKSISEHLPKIPKEKEQKKSESILQGLLQQRSFN